MLIAGVLGDSCFSSSTCFVTRLEGDFGTAVVEDFRLLVLACVRRVDCVRLVGVGVVEVFRVGVDVPTRRLDVDGFLSGVRVELREGVGG